MQNYEVPLFDQTMFLLETLKEQNVSDILKFIYSEKATKFCGIFTLLLSYVVPVKNKVKISQNFVAFSEYMNFNQKETCDSIWSQSKLKVYIFSIHIYFGSRILKKADKLHCCHSKRVNLSVLI